jgi:hypothetical protein
MHADTLEVSSVTRSTADIDAELFKLYQLANRAPAVNERGEPIAAAIRAQIAVLKGRLTTSEAGERFEDDHEYVLHEALNAAEWLHDDEESPSATWADLGVILN